MSSTGAQGDRESSGPAISRDANHVAFGSRATNFVAGQTHGLGDVYERNLSNATTMLISATPAGLPGNALSMSPAISTDGRYVAFMSDSTDLVSGDVNGEWDVFLRDVVTGTTAIHSVSSAGDKGNALSGSPAISADGRYIAFDSNASNLVAGDSNGRSDIFVRDVVAGTTSKISIGLAGAQPNEGSNNPAISADGRFVAFQSLASNLVTGDTNAASDVFVRDRQTSSTTRVSISTQGLQGVGGDSYAPEISDDGNRISFVSDATTLVVGDTNAQNDIFLRDRAAGTTSRASIGNSGAQANSASNYHSISGDGRLVSFGSPATNLVTGDTNNYWDVFVRNLSTSTTARVSLAANGAQGNSDSVYSSLASDGRYLAFDSSASNLVAGDTNGNSDVLRHDAGETAAPSISALAADPRAFSPNGNGVQDTTTLNASVSDATPPIEWVETIKNPSGVTVRTFAGTLTESSGTISNVWDGTNASSASVPDGIYTWVLAASDDWGNAASASSTVVVDRVPPAVSSTAPSSFQDVLSTASVSLTWLDPGSGLNTSSPQISIDGNAFPVSVSGNTVTANTSGLQPGIHEVLANASDQAGNGGQETVLFTFASLSADQVAATMPSRTMKVNPSGTVPGPTTVTFHAVPLNAPAFSEHLNASTWVGYGTIARSYTLGTAEVVFNNGTPLTSTKNVSIPAGSFIHQVGTLAPSAGQLVAHIPAQSVTLADITVNIPTGYNTGQSTATLKSLTTQLGSPTVTGSFLANRIYGSIDVSGQIAGCFERHPTSTSYCQADQTPGVQFQPPGSGPIPLFTPLTASLDQSNEGQIPPSCVGCETSFDVVQARLVLGCSLYTVGGTSQTVDLCNGGDPSSTFTGKYFGSYLNGWIYSVPNEGVAAPTYPFWRQDHLDLGSDECPNGGLSAGSVSSSLSRAASNSIALDGAAGPLSAGTWPSPLPASVKLGATTGPTDSSSTEGPSFTTTSLPYQLENQVSLVISPKSDGYTIARGSSIDEYGVQSAYPGATHNSWVSSSPITDRLQLINGTDFASPSPAGGFAYSGLVNFQLTLTFNC